MSTLFCLLYIKIMLQYKKKKGEIKKMNPCEKCDFYIYENGVYICIKNDDCEDINDNN